MSRQRESHMSRAGVMCQCVSLAAPTLAWLSQKLNVPAASFQQASGMEDNTVGRQGCCQCLLPGPALVSPTPEALGAPEHASHEVEIINILISSALASFFQIRYRLLTLTDFLF